MRPALACTMRRMRVKRHGQTIKLAGIQTQGFFNSNATAILAEERLAMQIRNPESFVNALGIGVY